MHLTHAYVHWLADPDESGQTVHSGGFAPATRQMPITSVVRGT